MEDIALLTMHAPPSVAPADKDDLWFLEVVAELRTPLCMLTGPTVALGLNMRRGHGLSPAALCEKLASLRERALIRVYRAGDEAQVAPTRAEIERALAESTRRDPNGFVYGLTEKGGAAWAHYARPDWSRYVSAEWGFEAWGSGPDECVIKAISLEAAEQEYQRHERSGDAYRKTRLSAPAAGAASP